MLGFESECAFLDIQASQNLAGFTLYFISFVYYPGRHPVFVSTILPILVFGVLFENFCKGNSSFSRLKYMTSFFT